MADAPAQAPAAAPGTAPDAAGSRGLAVRVAVVEDESLMRWMVRKIVEARPDMVLVHEAAGYAAGRDVVQPGTADVVVMDIDLGDGNGVALATLLQQRDPRLGVLLFSSHDVLDLVLAVRDTMRRPWSYLSKKSSLEPVTLARAIHATARGEVVLDPELVNKAEARAGSALAALTKGQMKVLRLAAEGYSNAYIAETLALSPRSVENHLHAIYKALDIPTENANPRVMAVLAFVQQSSRY